MIKLTKEQRDRIIAIGLGTVVVMVGLWFGLLSFQREALAQSRKRITEVETKVKDAQALLLNATKLEEAYNEKRSQLNTIEASMASGNDLYIWILSTLTQFKSSTSSRNAPYLVDIPRYFPAETGKVGMFPNFPYQAATFRIEGSARYHDLGRFLADFENHFPYMRLQNLEIGAASGSESTEPEKLKFSLQIVALIKPTLKK